MNYAQTVMERMKEEITAALTSFPAGFNPRSPKEVETLFRANGFSDADFAKTDTGKWSFTEKWLQTNEIGKSILSVRQRENARDKFILPMIERQNHNGRIHPVLNQSKTDEFGVAGPRLSCSDPNMQAQPKRNKVIGKIVRPLVIPDDGMLIEEGDFVQQEPRFFTHYSQDPVLLDGYRTETLDIHDRSSEILHIDRDHSKRLGLGMLTMMSPKTLAGHMNYSIEEARRDHRMFLTDAFPMIKQFQDDAKAVMIQRGYVRDILGRRAYHSGVDWEAYKAVSRIIQNSGGEHMKTALLRANQYEDAYPNLIQMLLSIHDSTIWQRDPGHNPRELVRLIENVVHEPQFNLSVPIPIELGSGLNWSEASYNKPHLKDKHGWLPGYLDKYEAA
jgi:DNA polymerase I-like protein with 3'-5' exonuclease and polymerase domains